MIKLLSIGNSFSQDAHAYLHDLAEAGGADLKTVNLYIGGCSLRTHWENAEHDYQNYSYELNGNTGGERQSSIKEALTEDHWDLVSLQQVSHESGLIDTYFPYMEQLSAYVKQYAPGAKQLIHQTWAYETDSSHEGFVNYGRDQQRMYGALKSAYAGAARRLALPLIPAGSVIQTLRGKSPFDYPEGGLSLCRDGFHLSYTYGRYAAAAAWYECLIGDVRPNGFIPPGESVETGLITVIKQTAHEICAKS